MVEAACLRSAGILLLSLKDLRLDSFPIVDSESRRYMNRTGGE